MQMEQANSDQVGNDKPKSADEEETIKCPACTYIIGDKIYNCLNGHNICKTCVTKLEDDLDTHVNDDEDSDTEEKSEHKLDRQNPNRTFKCPSCNDIGKKYRNLQVERLTRDFIVGCAYEDCPVRIKRCEYDAHVAECRFKPLPCPISENCMWSHLGLDNDKLLEHLLTVHKDTCVMIHNQVWEETNLWYYSPTPVNRIDHVEDDNQASKKKDKVTTINFIILMTTGEIIFFRIVANNKCTSFSSFILKSSLRPNNKIDKIKLNHKLNKDDSEEYFIIEPRYSFIGTDKYTSYEDFSFLMGRVKILKTPDILHYLIRSVQASDGSWSFTSPIIPRVLDELNKFNPSLVELKTDFKSGLSKLLNDLFNNYSLDFTPREYFCEENKLLGTMLVLYFIKAVEPDNKEYGEQEYLGLDYLISMTCRIKTCIGSNVNIDSSTSVDTSIRVNNDVKYTPQLLAPNKRVDVSTMSATAPAITPTLISTSSTATVIATTSVESADLHQQLQQLLQLKKQDRTLIQVYTIFNSFFNIDFGRHSKDGQSTSA